MKQLYQDEPLAELKQDGWTAQLRIPVDATNLVYGVVIRPDGTIAETQFPIDRYALRGTSPRNWPDEAAQEEVRQLLDSYRRV
jgi:hypothetical protein